MWSSIDLMTIWMMMILITSDAILWNGYIKKLTVEEMKTTGWGHFGYLYHTQLFPQLGLWSFAISTFLRKPNLRKCKWISNWRSWFLRPKSTLLDPTDFLDFFRLFRDNWSEIKEALKAVNKLQINNKNNNKNNNKKKIQRCTVFENHRKSLIQHCKRSKLHLHFEWTKVN